MIENNIVPLPRLAQTVANVIGRDATLALASKCKCQCIYIPLRDMPDNHPIVRTIGRDLAEQLQQAFGGEIIPLPRCTITQNTQRNEDIRIALASGRTRKEVAKEFGISNSNLLRIVYPHLAERNRAQIRQRHRVRRTYQSVRGQDF